MSLPNVAASRSSVGLFSAPTVSRPDWSVVSHLFADALYELEVLNLGHASEPTATDAAIQMALAEGLPLSAIPNILTEAGSGSLFSPKVGNGLGYRSSVMSTVSRARSSSRRRPPPAPSSQHSSTLRTSIYSQAQVTATQADTILESDSSTENHTRATSNSPGKRLFKKGKSQAVPEILEISNPEPVSLSVDVLGELYNSSSRPSSRSRQPTRNVDRSLSRSRSRSQSRIRSQASSIFRRSIEIVRSGPAFSSEKPDNSQHAEKENRSSFGDEAMSSINDADLCVTCDQSCSNESMNRTRRQRFAITTDRPVIPEENEDEPTRSERTDALTASKPASAPQMPANTAMKKANRRSSFRQLLHFWTNQQAHQDSRNNTSSVLAKAPQDGPGPKLIAKTTHSRSASQTTAISISSSIFTMKRSGSLAQGSQSELTRRRSSRRNRLSNLFVAPFRSSVQSDISIPKHNSTNSEKTDGAEDGGDRSRRRLSRIRSSLLSRSPSFQWETQKLRSSSAVLVASGPSGSENCGPVAPPVPPPPKVTLSTPVPSRSSAVIIMPTDLEALSALHTQHRLVTDRFDNFFTQQKLHLTEYRSRAMKRVVHAHIIARVPLHEELRRYKRAEAGYMEFCKKISQTGLITNMSTATAESSRTSATNQDNALLTPEKCSVSSRIGSSFDSGIAFAVDYEMKADVESTKEGKDGDETEIGVLALPSPQSQTSAGSKRSSSSTIPSSPAPSPTATTFSPNGASVSRQSAAETVSDVSEPAGLRKTPTIEIQMSSSKADRRMSIPQPPPTPAHSAALLRLSRLDASMAAQTGRLIEAFGWYNEKLYDLFQYRAERVLGRWVLDSRVVVWRWLEGERGHGPECELDSPCPGKTLGAGVLADPGFVETLDISNVDVPLGWGSSLVASC